MCESRGVRAGRRWGLIVLVALCLILGLPADPTTASYTFNGSDGTWTDSFDDPQNGLSSSSWASGSAGALSLTLNPTNSWALTTQAEFDTGTFTRTLSTAAAGGGVVLDDPSYVEVLSANTWDPTGDNPQAWTADKPGMDDNSWTWSLPFAFPFYGQNYTSVEVNSNGYLHFVQSPDYEPDPWIPDATELEKTNMIAPLWMDIMYHGTAQAVEDIFLAQGADWVSVRWQAEAYLTNEPVDVKVKLHQDGRIEYSYGGTNTNIGGGDYRIGVSQGNQADFIHSGLNLRTNLTWAEDVLYRSEGTFTSVTDDGSEPGMNKQYDQIVITTDPLPSGASVEMSYSVDGGAYQSAGTLSGTGQTTDTFNLPTPTGNTIRTQAKLIANGPASTPVLKDVTVNFTYQGYRGSGSATSVSLPPSGSVAKWGSVHYVLSQPASTTAVVDVLDASDDSLLIAAVQDGHSLATVSTSTKIKLKASFTTSDSSVTPSIAQWSVDYDPTAPSASIVSVDPVAGGFDVTFNASDPDTGPADLEASPIYAFVKRSGETNWYQVAGPISYTEPGNAVFNWDTTLVADGDYQLKVQAVDKWELSAEETWGANLTVDNVGGGPYSDNPVATLSAPDGGEFWSGTKTVSFSVADGNLLAQPIAIYASRDGTTWYRISDLSALESYPPGSHSWNTAVLNANSKRAFPDASTYRVRVVALDSNGLWNAEANGTSTATFTVDNLGPSFTVSTSANPAKAGPTTITVTASENLKSPPSVTVTQNGRGPSSVVMTGSGTVFTGTYTVVSGYDGAASIAAQGTDLADNIGTTILSGGSFTVDTIAPAAPTISTPTNNQIFTGGPISASGSGEIGSVVTLKLNGGTTYTTNGGAFTFDSIPITLAYNYGYNSLSFTATDPAGNVSAASTRTVKYNDPPDVSFVSPTAASTLKDVSTVQWTSSDANNDTLVFTLEYNDGDGGWSTLASNLSGSTYDWNTPLVADGNQYRLRLSTSDGTAGVSTTSSMFTVDNDLPDIAINAVADPTNDSTPTFQGRATSAETRITITSVQYAVDSTTSWSAATADDGQFNSRNEWFTFTLPALSDGQHTVYVRSLDSEGNYTPSSQWASQTFTVDTIAPKAPGITWPTWDTVVSDQSDTSGSTKGTQISVTGPAEASSTIKLTLGSAGYTATSAGTGVYTVTGVTPSHGRNLFYLTATDAAGNTSATSTGRVTHNNPPSVKFSAPLSGDWWGGTRTISWSPADPDGDLVWWYAVYLKTPQGTKKTLVSYTKSTSYAWNTAVQADGVYTIEVHATDWISTGSSSVAFNIDNTPPAAPTVTWPLAGDVISKAADSDPAPGLQIAVRGEAEPYATVHVKLDSKTWSGSTDSQGVFFVKGVTLAHGLNEFTAWAQDRADNAGPKTASSAIANNPPTVALLAPGTGTIWGSTHMVRWKVSDEDGDPITSVAMSYRTETTSAVIAQDLKASAWALDTSQLPEGEVTLTVSATDGVSTGSASAEILVDNSLPSVDLAIVGQALTRETRPTFTGAATDQLSALEYVEYSMDDGPWYRALVVSGFKKKSTSYRLAHPIPLNDGTHSIQARATDQAGNVGYSRTLKFRIDNTPPTIGGNMFRYGPTVLVPAPSGTVEVVQGQAVTMMVAVGGEPKTVTGTIGEQTVEFAYDLDTGLFVGDLVPKHTGNQSIELEASDVLGNTTSREAASLLVDPSGYIYDAADGSRVRGATVTLYYLQPDRDAWVVWDAEAFGQQNPQTTPKDGSYGFMVPPGSYYIEVSAKGYALHRSQTVVVEADRPVFLNIGLKPDRGWLKVGDGMTIVTATIVVVLGSLVLFGLLRGAR